MMALRELSEAEWQHSFVPVLKLTGPGSNTPNGDNDHRARELAVGDVKHIMVRLSEQCVLDKRSKVERSFV